MRTPSAVLRPLLPASFTIALATPPVSVGSVETVSVTVAEEILANQNRRLLGGLADRVDLFVKHDHRAAGGQGHLCAVEFAVVLGGFERQVQHGECQHQVGLPKALIGGNDFAHELGCFDLVVCRVRMDFLDRFIVAIVEVFEIQRE